MKLLFIQGAVEYRELKEILNISDGKLAGHIKSLVDNEPPLVKAEKMNYEPEHLIDRTRSKFTTYILTKLGRNLFEQFNDLMRRIIEIGEEDEE